MSIVPVSILVHISMVFIITSNCILARCSSCLDILPSSINSSLDCPLDLFAFHLSMFSYTDASLPRCPSVLATREPTVGIIFIIIRVTWHYLVELIELNSPCVSCKRFWELMSVEQHGTLMFDWYTETQQFSFFKSSSLRIYLRYVVSIWIIKNKK